MRPLHLLPVLFATTFACYDGPVGVTPIAEEPNDEVLESIPGYLITPRLLRSGTWDIPLAGSQTALFTDLVGAEMLINGVIDPADGALIIREFFVLAVDGLPAYDGMLQRTGTAFMIRTMRGGNVPLEELPSGLMEHVGKRVWLTTQEGLPVRYGVLQN